MSDQTKSKVAVVAIGGNSLIKYGKRVSVEDQYPAAKETTLHIAAMIEAEEVAQQREKGEASAQDEGQPE